jgi:hypothetical protein
VGTDVVETATDLCQSIVQEFPKATVFTGRMSTLDFLFSDVKPGFQIGIIDVVFWVFMILLSEIGVNDELCGWNNDYHTG